MVGEDETVLGQDWEPDPPDPKSPIDCPRPEADNDDWPEDEREAA
jgi:hypothetical protein